MPSCFTDSLLKDETTQSFVISQQSKYFENVSATILENRFLYLSPFDLEFRGNHIQCYVDLDKYPLSAYIHEYWYSHLRQDEQTLLVDQNKLEALRKGIYQCLYMTPFYSSQEFDPGWTPKSPFTRFGMFQGNRIAADFLSDVHLAAACDLQHTLSMLLNAGHSPNVRTKDYHQYTALEIAVEFGALRTSKCLIQEAQRNGEWKNVDHGKLLALAAESGMSNMIEALLNEKDVDVNARDPHGHTALKNAVISGHISIARKLIAREEVDVNASSKMFPSTVLEAAFRHHSCLKEEEQGDYDDLILSILLDPRFDISAGRAGFSSMDNVRSSVYAELQQKYRNQFLAEAGLTVLAHATAHGKFDVVQDILLQTPEEINRVGHSGSTPILLAVARRRTEIANHLLKSNPPPDVELKDAEGNTPLALAVHNCQLEMAQLLIVHGANTRVQIQGGKTLLHVALCPFLNLFNVRVDKRIGELVSILLDHGVDVNGADDNNQTPLFLAASHGSRILAQLLLSRGANIHAVDKDLRTPISYAVATSDADEVKRGFPAEAFLKRRWNAVRLLLDHGADLDAREKEDLTPLKRAESSPDEPILKYLREYVNREPSSEDTITATIPEEPKGFWGYKWIYDENYEE